MNYIRNFRLLLISALLLIGCGEPKNPSFSKDVLAIQKIVRLPIPITFVRWEVFNYPEEVNGFMPPNIDSTVLIAEIGPSDERWMKDKQTPIKAKWLNSNDARPWISTPFRDMLSAETIDLRKYKCAYYETIRLATREKVNGFACEVNGRTLLYLLLEERT